MSAQHEYFVASPAELAALDPTTGPTGQLPADRAEELPGVDPMVVLLTLVEVLSTSDYDTVLARSGGTPAFDGGSDGPWVTAIDDFVVDAIRGADGDPELEWDDVVAQWGDRIGEEMGDADEDRLLEVAAGLRRLCGQVDDTHRLYAWTAL